MNFENVLSLTKVFRSQIRNWFKFHLKKRWISKREFECKINRITIVEIYDDA